MIELESLKKDPGLPLLDHIKLVEGLIFQLNQLNVQKAFTFFYKFVEDPRHLFAIAAVFNKILQVSSNFKLEYNYLQQLSDRFKVCIVVRNYTGLMHSKCTSPVPIVYLFNTALNGSGIFSVLYHEEAYQMFIDGENPTQRYPFVWEAGKINDFDDNLAKTMPVIALDSPKILKSVKIIEEERIDMTVLDALFEIALQANIKIEDLKAIDDCYRACGFVNDKLELLCKRREYIEENRETIHEYLVKGLSGCESCKRNKPNQFNISCKTHILCTECRVEYFATNFYSDCPICHREMSDAELQVINSLIN